MQVIVDKIHEIRLDDQETKISEVFEALGVWTEQIHHILPKYSNMKKLSAK